METLSALLAICAGNSPVNGEFPAQRPVTRSFGAVFDLHPKNNGEAGDLKRYRAHYNVTVMFINKKCIWKCRLRNGIHIVSTSKC